MVYDSFILIVLCIQHVDTSITLVFLCNHTEYYTFYKVVVTFSGVPYPRITKAQVCQTLLFFIFYIDFILI